MTKAITLHQPWATLIALGVKTIETRSWKPPAALIGERLLIHAGKQYGKAAVVRFVKSGALRGASQPFGAEMPLGAIVASCVLADAVPMTDGTGTSHICEGLCTGKRTLALAWPDPDSPIDVSDQRAYGDFAPGRWAWLLEDVKPTTERCPACWEDRPFASVPLGAADICPVCGGAGSCEPIPAKGHQRLWEWTP